MHGFQKPHLACRMSFSAIVLSMQPYKHYSVACNHILISQLFQMCECYKWTDCLIISLGEGGIFNGMYAFTTCFRICERKNGLSFGASVLSFHFDRLSISLFGLSREEPATKLKEE